MATRKTSRAAARGRKPAGSKPAGSKAARRSPGRTSAARKPSRPRAASAASSRASSPPAGKSRPAFSSRLDERRRAPETLRLRSMQPSLTVNDLARSVRFYEDVLGFMVSERWTDGGVLRGVMLRAGLCEIGLSQDDWSKGKDRKKGEGVRIWCQTAQDIDALAGRIKSAGGRLSDGPMDQSWGARTISLDDPDGFHLTIYREPDEGKS